MELTFRELPPAEWDRIVADGIEPYASHGLPDPTHAVCLVAEFRGHIVGVSLLMETVQNHWSIAPEMQHSPSTVIGLWRETKRVLDAHQIPLIHATVNDAQVDVQAMVEALGYVPADGKLYILSVADAVLNKKAS